MCEDDQQLFPTNLSQSVLKRILRAAKPPRTSMAWTFSARFFGPVSILVHATGDKQHDPIEDGVVGTMSCRDEGSLDGATKDDMAIN